MVELVAFCHSLVHGYSIQCSDALSTMIHHVEAYV